MYLGEKNWITLLISANKSRYQQQALGDFLPNMLILWPTLKVPFATSTPSKQTKTEPSQWQNLSADPRPPSFTNPSSYAAWCPSGSTFSWRGCTRTALEFHSERWEDERKWSGWACQLQRLWLQNWVVPAIKGSDLCRSPLKVLRRWQRGKIENSALIAVSSC